MKSPASETANSTELKNARLRGDLLTLSKRVSHDLRTPLGGIVNTAEAIREVLMQHDPAAVGLADSLLTSAEEMTQIIKQVSFMTCATADPLPKSTVHMAEAVFAALQRLESRILKRQAIVVEPASWPILLGVRPWLEVIWWHLILNTLKPEGANRRIELGWNKEPKSLRFWIRDNGPGVSAGLQAKLFCGFHALHEEQGVPGLGLSIVQRLVELQGGACGYETVETGGAGFFFTLPLTENAG